MKLSLYLSLFFLPFFSLSQSNTDFDLIYDRGEASLISNFDSCSNSIEHLKNLPDLNNLQRIRIEFLETKAKCQLQSIDTTMLILNKCLEKLSQSYPENMTQKAEILMLLGSMNSSNSNVCVGIPQLMAAQELFLKTDDRNKQHYCRIRIAEAHRVKKQFKIGFDLLYDLLKERDLSVQNRCNLYGRLASYYDECVTGAFNYNEPSFNRLDSTFKYTKLSAQIAEQYNFKGLKASSYNQLGHFMMHYRSEIDSAVIFLSQAAQTFKELGDYANYVNTSNNINSAYQKKGQFHKAIATSKHLLTIRKGEEYPQIYRKTYKHLSDSYDSIGDYRLAKKYLERVYAIEKGLFKTYLNKEVTALTTKYNYELKEAQLAEEQHKSHFRLALFLGIFLITIILLIVAIVVNRLRKMVYMQKQHLLINKNSILQNNIIHHNKTLTMNALRFVQNDNLLNEISQQVGAMEYLKKADLKEALQNLISEIRVSKKNEVWNDFEKSFKEVHADFYKNLTKEHADLSSKELRLCAFLKLNLTSKEIAAINGMSPRTVETARHRLRKKLNVAEGTDLNSFFQKF
ncbi:LuxR C-terminal-related transcriptional regulator [Ancylomarina sp. YFZ004]